MTIDAEFASHDVDMGDELIRLVIWGLVGQRHFHVVRHSFYRGAKAVILVYEITNQESWGDLSRRCRSPAFSVTVAWQKGTKAICPLSVRVGRAEPRGTSGRAGLWFRDVAVILV
jgi:hypothetical protein